MESLIEEYQTRTLNSGDNFPNLIIVNSPYLIEKVGSQSRSFENGRSIPSDSSIAISASRCVGGWL